MSTKPVRVLLRCKDTAVVKQRHAEISETFDLIGVLDDTGSLELWRADGKWRENGEPHALDIVGVESNGHFLPFTGLTG